MKSDEFITAEYLKQIGFELNEEDDSWHKGGYAVSVNEETNECIFYRISRQQKIN
jgi:hypothetical protein